MKILVIGLDGAIPELLFGDEQLIHIRRLMEVGCYGRLEGVTPPGPISAWMSMSTSQDPGVLGLFGRCNRVNYSYDGFEVVNLKSIQENLLHRQLNQVWEHPILIGMSLGGRPSLAGDANFDCFETPFIESIDQINPDLESADLNDLFEDELTRLDLLADGREESLRKGIFAASHRYFEIVRNVLQKNEWDYFQVHDIGLDLIQSAFWRYHDPQHRMFEQSEPRHDVIREYYQLLDEEIGSILGLVDDDTSVLIISPYSAQRIDGGFFVNQWLIEQGLLVLNTYPNKPTHFSQLDINWQKTRVWSQGGFVARIFFNVKDREPQGVIDAVDYESFRDELLARFLAILDDHGQPMDNNVFRPEEVYQSIKDIAPDLIVHFGDSHWYALSSVGHSSHYAFADNIGLYGCNYAQRGSFILATPESSLQGLIHDANILDIFPTLLELGGIGNPGPVQGMSLFTSHSSATGKSETGLPEDEEALIRERLKGLGYI